MRKQNGSQQTLLEKVLRGADGERWFGDGPPLWTQGRKDRPAKTLRQARLQRRQLVKALRRHGRGDEAALRLADKIAACRPRRRCLSGACPECTRATQRLFVATSDRLITLSEISMIAVSVVFRGAGIAEGKLAQTGRPIQRSLTKAARGAAKGRRAASDRRVRCFGKRTCGSTLRISLPAARMDHSAGVSVRARGKGLSRILSPEQDHSPPGICEVLRRGPQGAGLRRQNRLCSADIAPATTTARRQRQPAQYA